MDHGENARHYRFNQPLPFVRRPLVKAVMPFSRSLLFAAIRRNRENGKGVFKTLFSHLRIAPGSRHYARYMHKILPSQLPPMISG